MTVQWCETTFWAPTFACENGGLVLPTWHKVNGFQQYLATCHVRRLMSLPWGKFSSVLEILPHYFHVNFFFFFHLLLFYVLFIVCGIKGCNLIFFLKNVRAFGRVV